jgi:hypothetical protein
VGGQSEYVTKDIFEGSRVRGKMLDHDVISASKLQAFPAFLHLEYNLYGVIADLSKEEANSYQCLICQSTGWNSKVT